VALGLLKGEHAQLGALFQNYEAADNEAKEQALRELAQELIVQMVVKEQVLYPALLEAKVEDSLINEALVSSMLPNFFCATSSTHAAGTAGREGRPARGANGRASRRQGRAAPPGLLAKAAGIDDAGYSSRACKTRKALEADGEGGMPELTPVVTFVSQSGTSRSGNRQSGSSRHPGEDINATARSRTRRARPLHQQ
jgi:hypothetical protein